MWFRPERLLNIQSGKQAFGNGVDENIHKNIPLFFLPPVSSCISQFLSCLFLLICLCSVMFFCLSRFVSTFSLVSASVFFSLYFFLLFDIQYSLSSEQLWFLPLCLLSWTYFLFFKLFLCTFNYRWYADIRRMKDNHDDLINPLSVWIRTLSHWICFHWSHCLHMLVACTSTKEWCWIFRLMHF